MFTRLSVGAVLASLLAAAPVERPTEPAVSTIAVLPVHGPARSSIWDDDMVRVTTDAFDRELRGDPRLAVIGAREVGSTLRSLRIAESGRIDDETARRIGRSLQVDYVLVVEVTELEWHERNGLQTAVAARIVGPNAGDLVWSDEVRHVDREATRDMEPIMMFDKVMKPAVMRLTASIRAADL